MPQLSYPAILTWRGFSHLTTPPWLEYGGTYCTMLDFTSAMAIGVQNYDGSQLNNPAQIYFDELGSKREAQIFEARKNI